MLRLTITVAGVTAVDRSLARFGERVTDLRPAFEAIAQQFGQANKEQFDSEGAASGGWKPLSTKYGVWKAAHFPGAKILHRTGALEKSLTARPFGIERVTTQLIEMGTAIDYAQYHQKGRRGCLPGRRWRSLRSRSAAW